MSSSSQITWLCNGDFVKESDRKMSSLNLMENEKNKWTAKLTILVSHSILINPPYKHRLKTHCAIYLCLGSIHCHQVKLLYIALSEPRHHLIIVFCHYFRIPVKMTLETTNVQPKINGEMTTLHLNLAEFALTSNMFIN